MNAADFLGLLLPEQGFIVIAEPITIPGLNHQPFKHHVFSELAPALLHKLAAPPPVRAYDLAPFDWNRIAAQTRDVFERAATGRVLRT